MFCSGLLLWCPVSCIKTDAAIVINLTIMTVSQVAVFSHTSGLLYVAAILECRDMHDTVYISKISLVCTCQ